MWLPEGAPRATTGSGHLLLGIGEERRRTLPSQGSVLVLHGSGQVALEGRHPLGERGIGHGEDADRCLLYTSDAADE